MLENRFFFKLMLLNAIVHSGIYVDRWCCCRRNDAEAVSWPHD